MVNLLLVVAVVLNPRCKLEYLVVAYEKLFDESMINYMATKVKKVLERLYDWYEKSYPSSNFGSHSNSILILQT